MQSYISIELFSQAVNLSCHVKPEEHLRKLFLDIEWIKLQLIHNIYRYNKYMTLIILLNALLNPLTYQPFPYDPVETARYLNLPLKDLLLILCYMLQQQQQQKFKNSLRNMHRHFFFS